MIVTIETNITPSFTFDTENKEGSSRLLSFIQPRVVATQVPLVGSVELAPRGNPVSGLGVFVFIVLMGVFVAGVISLARK